MQYECRKFLSITVFVPAWGRWLVYGWAWALVEPLAVLLKFERAVANEG
jgi:hypothetical protein